MSLPNWQSLQQSADRARKGADHAKAIDLYAKALGQPNLPWEAMVNMSMAYADSLKMLGRLAEADTQLSGLAQRASQQGDKATMVNAVASWIFLLRKTGDFKRGIQLGEEALITARETRQPDLIADALLSLGIIHNEIDELSKAQDYLTEAEKFITEEDKLKRLKAHFIKGNILGMARKYHELELSTTQALEIARSIGDRDWEGIFLNQLAIFTTDIALQRALYDQALTCFEAVGDIPYQNTVQFNMVTIDIWVGLYKRSIESFKSQLDKHRAMGLDSLCLGDLNFLGIASFMNNDLLTATEYANELLTLARKMGSDVMEYISQQALSLFFLVDEQPMLALEALQVTEKLPYQRTEEDLIYDLSLRSITNFVLGDPSAARKSASEALTRMNELISSNPQHTGFDLPAWYCYRALSPLKTAGRKGKVISRKAWLALDLGLKDLLKPIETTSDAGLRRGYLHRDFVHRLLIVEWLKYAPSQGVSQEQIANYSAIVQKSGRLDEVFDRLLKVGVRLNSLRDPAYLPDEIVDETNELTGAERIALVLFDDQCERHLVRTQLPQPPYPVFSGKKELPPDQETFLEEIKPYLDEVCISKQGFIRQLNPDADLVEQISILVSPLICRGKLIGVVYCDLRGCFGCFDLEDLNLLGVLANQSAVALENAEWLATLEQKVADRTAELKQSNDHLEHRTAELTILNSVGEAMARTLDVKTVIRIVGDKVRDIFSADQVSISLVDFQNNLVLREYSYDVGEGGYVDYLPPSFPLGQGMSSEIILTKQPLLLGTIDEQSAHGAVLPAEAMERSIIGRSTQSYMGVPIIVNDQVLGLVSLSDYDEYAYKQENLQLLQTLAANTGVAIANARLFQAEQERVNELQIINSIQKGLAAELDFQAIVDLVGDKLREVFKTPDLSITWYEEKSDLLHQMYVYEHGKRLTPLPLGHPTPTGPFSRIRESHQSVIWNTAEEGDVVTGGVVPGTDRSLSGVMIPIISKDKVQGIIQLENFTQEHAFGETQLRVLTTIAASLGSALENARLFDETQRLFKAEQERVSELQIINSIQQGLAAELNFRAIIDLVGDKLREVLATGDLGIHWYDEKTNLLHFLYSYEHGKRLSIEPSTPVPNGVFEQLSKSRGVMIANTASDFEGITSHVPDTDYGKSAIAVPIISSDRVLGIISIENFEREYAFGESEARLLTTIAASLGTALENARLFDETQRLFKAEQDRVNELQIINSIQRGLAAELDFQAIVDLVGDKLREVFKTDDLGITWLDSQTNQVNYLYIYEHGKRIYAPPTPPSPGGIYETMMKTRQPHVMSQADMAKIIPMPGTDRSLSAVYIPVISGDRFLGDISVENFERENAFGEAEIRLLTTIAASLGTALENARLFDETQRLLKETEQRAAELAILNSVGDAMASNLDIKTITHLVGDKVREIFASECVVIYLHDPATQKLHPPYLYDKGYIDTDQSDENDSDVSTDPIHHAIIVDRKSLIFETFKQLLDHGAKVWPDAEGGSGQTNSFMGVPIIVGEQVRGLVSVQSYREHAYDASNLRLLSTLASSMGVAIENARLFQETQRLLDETRQRNSELAIINSIQAGLASKLDIQAIYELVGEKIREIFDANVVVLATFDLINNIMDRKYSIEKGERQYIDPAPIPSDWLYFIQQGQPELINNHLKEFMQKVNPEFTPPAGEIPKCSLSVPIRIHGNLFGVISLQNVDRENAFSESDLHLLETLANSLSVALENARLFNETQRLLTETEQRNAELAIINSVQAALAAELDIQGIYDAVGDKIREIFHTGNVDIRIYDPKTNIVSFPYEYEEGIRIHMEPMLLPEKGFSTHVIRTRETLVINENMEQALEKYGSYVFPGTLLDKSNVWVPLVVGDQARGLICLSDYQHEHAFSDSDVRLLQTLANSMSVALENARLFAEIQRLLEETSQRASELTIINRVSQAMSTQMEVEAIVHTVGDQVRDTLHSEVVNIYLYDPAEKMIRLPYSYDRKYVVSEPFPYGAGLTSKVIDTRQPLILKSFEEITAGGAILNPNAPEDELMPQSYLGVPIIVGDKAIGVIDVQSYKQCVYDESHVRLLSTLASSMGVALENARLFEETRRLLAITEQRNRELAIISRIGQSLVGQLDPQGIFELVGKELEQVFDAQAVAIITYDRQENLSHWRYLIEKGQRQYVPPQLPGGFSGHILRTRQPLLITHNVDQWAAELGSIVLAGEAPKSYLGVPLVAGGEVTGVITLQNMDREEAFNENDLRLLSTLALNMGVALENARLYQETQHHAVEMAALAEIGSDIASTHEMEPVLERLATKTRELMQVRDIALYLVQPDGHTLKPIVSQGKYAAETMAQTISIGYGITGNIAQSGVAEIINAPEHDPRSVHIEGTAPDEEEPECIMIAPLISRGKVIGAMSVYRDRDQGLFTQLELDFLVSLARQAAIAIESARLYAETERRATEMAALAEVSREISATLELQDVLERIAEQARELLAAGNSAVYLLQPDGETIKAIAAKGEITNQVLSDEVKLGEGIIGNIVKSGVAEWIDDTDKDPRGVHIPGTQATIEGEKLLVAPLLIQDRAIGALAVWRDPDDPLFNQAELSFAIGLAQQAVVAIENARLFESAQESQRRMADIIDFLPDATLVIDRQGRVIAWNHAIEEMTGVKAEDIVGKGEYEYAIPFYGERRPILIDMVLMPNEEIEAKYTHLQRTEGTLVGEAISMLKGQATYLNATASALKNSKGEAVGAIESIRNITDQKRAEQELHQAKLEAEQANQAKSAFLAMMSHEIRTPMNAIIGMSGLLMDTPLNTDQREFAETIRSSGDSLLNIINDILDFSKIEAGKLSLEEQPFDLRECIESSLDLIKIRASEKGLELAYQMDPEVPPAILGDVTRLRQVMINLLGNSVKFTDQGEIVLSVTRGDQANSLHFSVRDTGIGIAPERVSQLFRPFTQADASTSRRYGGTGLGLALSNRIVDMMGGRIWVESEGIPGKGSTFHFVIFAKPAPDWKARPQMQGEQPKLRGKRVLIVDDNATNRRVLELQTRSWGMLPYECATPGEALEALQQGEKFDLAILDMHMPDMSGVELADQIRILEASRPDALRLPLVLSTSLGGREEARESTEFAAILLKPIRQSALFDMLMTLFAGKAARPAKPTAERATLDPEMAARHPLHILLAEDNVVNQKLALRLLSQMGYRADVAANGLEVLQAVKRQPYDVILMDVQMPEMDGLEATRHLCSELATEKRPHIIAMTANAMQGDREICLEAGMDDYLSKPIRVDELVGALMLAQPKSGGL